MPYFLLVENGVGVKGYEYAEAPGENRVLGAPENYLQAWDGKLWLDTATAKNFRETQVIEQAELKIVEENKRKERTKLETMLYALILKVNELVAILNSRGEKITPIGLPK